MNGHLHRRTLSSQHRRADNLLDLYKIVVRDKNGKVLQSHERYRANVEKVVLDETALGHTVAVTRLTKETT